jgi:hypothetical protein
MTPEQTTPQTPAIQPRDAFAPDPSELTDAELALVVGSGVQIDIDTSPS